LKIVQPTGEFSEQFNEIVKNAIDRRQFAEVTTPGADVEFSISHGLGFIPLGFLVCRQDKPGITYASSTAWTTENVFLKCNVATTQMRVLIF
jgi:hypothetical protein